MKKTLLLFAILAFACMQVFGQRVVTGKVTDPDGNPLPYLTVSVKGTTTGTVTADQGNYSITIPSGDDVLAFSFIGMQPREVKVTGNKLDLVMQPSDYALGDVVVTALGRTREKKALGYTVQEVTGTELNKRGNSDIVTSLAAKAAGLQVTTSSSNAGAASYMTIRGAASLTGNNQPLFVIDGMPMSTEPSYRGSTGQSGVYSSSRSIDLNPDEIGRAHV